MAEKFISVPALVLRQPIGDFYVCTIGAKDLVDISFADVRRIEGEQREVEQYLGIQRPLVKKRVEELRQYVQMMDASFPTGIIVAVESSDARFDSKEKRMQLRSAPEVAKIIDGQHRIAGLEALPESASFDMVVVVFVDMDIQDQAMVFATINLSQTKVNKSLAYDLYEFAKARSPQKTCHEIARLLNRKEGSPFFEKIKILGTATEGRQETLSQAVFVDRLIDHICHDKAQAMHDRDQLRRGRKLSKDVTPEGRKLIFRNMFIDRRDAEIARVLWNFFEAVADRWKDAWTERRPGHVLNRTTGFGALMRFIRDAVLAVGGYEKVVSKDQFAKIFKAIDIGKEDFTPENYPPGTSGEAKLYRQLVEAVAG